MVTGDASRQPDTAAAARGRVWGGLRVGRLVLARGRWGQRRRGQSWPLAWVFRTDAFPLRSRVLGRAGTPFPSAFRARSAQRSKRYGSTRRRGVGVRRARRDAAIDAAIVIGAIHVGAIAGNTGRTLLIRFRGVALSNAALHAALRGAASRGVAFRTRAAVRSASRADERQSSKSVTESGHDPQPSHVPATMVRDSASNGMRWESKRLRRDPLTPCHPRRLWTGYALREIGLLPRVSPDAKKEPDRKQQHRHEDGQ
jgi:hypothetical protein